MRFNGTSMPRGRGGDKAYTSPLRKVIKPQGYIKQSLIIWQVTL